MCPQTERSRRSRKRGRDYRDSRRRAGQTMTLLPGRSCLEGSQDMCRSAVFFGFCMFFVLCRCCVSFFYVVVFFFLCRFVFFIRWHWSCNPILFGHTETVWWWKAHKTCACWVTCVFLSCVCFCVLLWVFSLSLCLVHTVAR